MASVNDEYKIPKLGQDNYYAWSVRSKAALIQKNCWEAVDPGYDDDEVLTDNQVKSNQKALSFILLVVSDTYLDDIGNCERASEAWSILEDIHSSFGLLHVLILLKEMVNVTKTKEISMQEYMSKIQNLNRKVATGGFNFDDRALALFFLLGLPLDTYEGLVRSMESDESKLTSKSVKSKLLLEEKRMQRVEKEETTSETENLPGSKVLATKTKGQNWQKNKKYKSSQNVSTKQDNTSTGRFVICFACGRKGHIAKHCDLKNKEENHYKKNEESKHADTVRTEHRVLCSKKHPTTDRNRWLLDSGATDHMTPHREKLQNYKSESTTVCTANGEQLAVAGQGTATIKLKDEYGGWSLTLTNVLHVPSLEDNLISMSRIEEKGYKQIIKDGRIDVIDDKVIIFSAFRKAHLYCVEEKDEIRSANSVTGNQTTLWHRRLGHAHIRSLGELGGVDEQAPKDDAHRNKDKQHRGEDDPSVSDATTGDACIVCIKGKMRRLSFPNIGSRKTTAPLELIHSDVVGKISPQSLGKANYFVTFIDDYSRYIFVRVIQAKSDVLQQFDIYRREVENEHDRKIKILRSDNGGEYTSGAFVNYLHEHGIKHQLTAPYTPQQNGIAERANQTLLGATRCQLIDAGMPNNFWAESLNTACHVRNRCKSAAIEGKVPHEVWTGNKDDLSYLRIFGCRAWAKVMQGSKLNERAIECVFLGYQEGVKGYRLWHLAKRQVIVSRDVVFEENVFPFKIKAIKEPILNADTGKVSDATNDDDGLLIYISEDEGEHCFDENEETPERNDESEHEEIVNDCSVAQNQEEDPRIPNTVNNPQVLRRSTRNRKEVSRYCCTAETLQNLNADIPLTPEDALSGKEAQEWREAMVEEINNLKQNRTWKIVKRPKVENVVRCKWIFRRKYDTFGKLQRHKARLVAQGFSQKEGVDYHETYSPVVKLKTIRLLMALSVELGWENQHVDITAAYLNSKLKEVIYMEQPRFFEEQPTDKYVCLLLKSLYGLHQSGREWNECIDTYLKKIGLTQSLYDPCVYYDKSGDLILALYVDDLAIFGKREKIDKFIAFLNENFKIKVLGELTSLLSLCIEKHEENCMVIHQKQYVKEVLKIFNMDQSRGVKTPLVVGEYYSTADEACASTERSDEAMYRKAIGCLLYLSNGSRPDLSFSVCYMSQFCNKATNEHWTAVKHILRYLHKTEERELKYHKCEEPLKIYVDADWASDKNDRRSFSGFTIILAGAAITWQTRKQRVTALSTVEAEYMAMAEATKEAIWLQGFLSEIKLEQFVQKPTVVCVDNQGAICLAKNRITSDKSKHIDVKYHFLREAVREGKVEFKYVPSQDNLADMFTKTLSAEKMEHHCAGLGFA